MTGSKRFESEGDGVFGVCKLNRITQNGHGILLAASRHVIWPLSSVRQRRKAMHAGRKDESSSSRRLRRILETRAGLKAGASIRLSGKPDIIPTKDQEIRPSTGAVSFARSRLKSGRQDTQKARLMRMRCRLCYY